MRKVYVLEVSKQGIDLGNNMQAKMCIYCKYISQERVWTSSSCDQQCHSCQCCVTGVCLTVMTHALDHSKFFESQSPVWKYRRSCSPKWMPGIWSQETSQSNFTLFLLHLPLKSHCQKTWIVVTFSKEKNTGWNVYNLPNTHLSPDAPLQEVIKRIFVGHRHGL